MTPTKIELIDIMGSVLRCDLYATLAVADAHDDECAWTIEVAYNPLTRVVERVRV